MESQVFFFYCYYYSHHHHCQSLTIIIVIARVSLCSPGSIGALRRAGCSGNHRDASESGSGVLGLKACTVSRGFQDLFFPLVSVNLALPQQRDACICLLQAARGFLGFFSFFLFHGESVVNQSRDRKRPDMAETKSSNQRTACG